MKDLNNRIPCAVSQELVELVANTFPERYRKNNGILITELLFDIGFKIDMSMKGYGYYKNFNVYVRDNSRPNLVYKTRCVYNGSVRNTVKNRTKCGKIEYTRCKHPLYYLYEQYEILQPKDLKDIIDEKRFLSIDDVGSEIAYNKAFLNNKNYTDNMKKGSGATDTLDGKDTILEDNTINILED